ncbi:MAG: CerR family C-terminal domain-containing protein [Proteobacteria bacterium]|nr:CerR family C-terminal domain-containing protein [Pseudomonadota bacterium]MBU1455646.1 CerR family C-terminal domain-containing protein [Pseudomonadota bacterium]
MGQDEVKSELGTQERLLEAAMDIFGRDGYESATTRNIAREAGVNIAAIPYYFKGKEGLYRAVITHIVQMAETQISDLVQAISHLTYTGDRGKEQALATLVKMMEKIIDFMVGSSQGQRVSRIILREQMYPTTAYELIFKGFMEPVLNSVSTLIIVITENPSRRTATLRAMAIIGQILAFRVARETVVRSLDLKGYDPDEMDEIRRIILEHTKNLLRSLM